jgi:hypothetical protein
MTVKIIIRDFSLKQEPIEKTILNKTLIIVYQFTSTALKKIPCHQST